jgi:N-acetyl-gamma-glutamyl-phosphate reductase
MVVHMGRTAAVAGASGYAGGELLRLLLEHPDLELGPVAGGSAAGKPVTDLHPQLPQLADAVFAATTAEVLGEADVVFLALPHGQSARSPRRCRTGCRSSTSGADHRLASADDWAASTTRRTPASGRTACPSCSATSSSAPAHRRSGLQRHRHDARARPLLAAGLVEPTDLVTRPISGTSGAGRGSRRDLLASEVLGSTAPTRSRPPPHARGAAVAAPPRRR